MPIIERVMILPGEATVTRVSDEGAVDVPIGEARRFDDLAADLGRLLDVKAAVRESAAPGAGTIVLCRPDVLHRLDGAGPATLAWVVAVDLPRPQLPARAERLGLAAGVEIVDFDRWVNPTGGPEPAALYGRIDVGRAMGASIASDPALSGEYYARLTHPDLDELPALLAAYLTTHIALL